MKKMLVSDYDKTFYLDDKDIQENIIAINRFREKGNIFVIATGRSWLDFKKKKDLYDIKYDYVILNHGATILDSQDNVIYNKAINNDIIQCIKDDLELDNVAQIFCCSKLESRVDFDYSNLTKIHVRYSNMLTTINVCKKLNKKYSDFIRAYLVAESAVEIISNKVDKSLSINLLIEKLGITANTVYTIGDGYSDIEMIRNFNGNCMKESVEALKAIAKKEYTSVSMLIKELMGENKDE